VENSAGVWHFTEVYQYVSGTVSSHQMLHQNQLRNRRMFNILSGVWHGCILSPLLFLIVIDYLMRKTVDGRDYRPSQPDWGRLGVVRAAGVDNRWQGPVVS